MWDGGSVPKGQRYLHSGWEALIDVRGVEGPTPQKHFFLLLILSPTHANASFDGVVRLGVFLCKRELFPCGDAALNWSCYLHMPRTQNVSFFFRGTLLFWQRLPWETCHDRSSSVGTWSSCWTIISISLHSWEVFWKETRGGDIFVFCGARIPMIALDAF